MLHASASVMHKQLGATNSTSEYLFCWQSTIAVYNHNNYNVIGYSMSVTSFGPVLLQRDHTFTSTGDAC